MLTTAFVSFLVCLPGAAAFSYSPVSLRPAGANGFCKTAMPLFAKSDPVRQSRQFALSVRASADWARFERIKFDGGVAIYTEELDGAYVGVLQASKPLTPENPYYEVEIIDGGTQSWIGVGVADSSYPLDKQPGWDQFSVGYHADDGSWYKTPIIDEKSKSGKPQAMPLTSKTFPCVNGDRLGVGLEFDDRGKEPSMKPRRVYFAKNGQYLGSVFLEKQFHDATYPTVGFNSPGAKAKINLNANSATVQLQHAAQSFGTNEYAIDVVKDALKNGADVNKQDAAGRTALHLAAAYGVAPIATLLLEQV